jgi:hypothetical protein
LITVVGIEATEELMTNHPEREETEAQKDAVVELTTELDDPAALLDRGVSWGQGGLGACIGDDLSPPPPV